MAIDFVTTEIHADARKVTGLPADEKKRVSEIQSIRNAVKRSENAVLIQRGGDVYVAKTEKAADAVKSANPVKGRGKSAKYDVKDMFA